MPKTKQSLEQRFWSKVEKTSTCWNWLGFTAGYGFFNNQGRMIRAHRFAFELIKGKIPENLVLDHLCRNRACVNPDHLEAVTSKINILRGIGIAAQKAKQTHCKRGHLLAGDNLSSYEAKKGKRRCKICEALKEKAYYQTHKEQEKARTKAYWQNHKEQRKDYDKAYYQTHKEQKKAYDKARYQSHNAKSEISKRLKLDEFLTISKPDRTAICATSPKLGTYRERDI